jgi:hypothetical protein
MKSNKKKLAILILFALIAGCGSGGSTTYSGKGGSGSVGGSGGSGGGSGVVSSPTITGSNVLPITVNGSLCLSSSYLNEPCVSVTICNPNAPTSCQTINGILLDTGSYGLRIFNQALTISLKQVASGTGSLAECAFFGSGAYWGPVQMADVYLGGEPKVSVPIQIFNSSYATVPGACSSLLSPYQSPSTAYFNGILGVGVLVYDSQAYFSCTGSSCTATTAALTDQVQNPVVSLPTDSNGLMVQLPSITSGGATAANGNLVLGIGTQTNNVPSGVTAYPANLSAEFITTVTGTTHAYRSSFIDSGSNGLFFNPISASQASLLPTSCTSTGWFCPSTIQNLSATNTGSTGSPSDLVSFQIANITQLNAGNNAFNDIGATIVPPADTFDWGLPFFYGKNVWIGIEGQTSTLGIGPYWAY